MSTPTLDNLTIESFHIGMSQTHAKSILELVASGAISPSEAAVLLDALPTDAGPDESAREFSDDGAEPTTVLAGIQQSGIPQSDAEPTRVITGEPTRVQPVRIPVEIGVHGGPIELICEPDTAVPYADGPARVTVDGDRQSGFRLDGSLGDESIIGLPAAIDLCIDANGTDFTLTGIDGTLRAQLNVGDVTIDGRFTDGESRIEANAGTIDLRLQPGSDVEVIARTAAMINADGLEHTGRGRWSLGSGTAKFEITGNLGSITITAL
jgi:hypothetical protein